MLFLKIQRLLVLYILLQIFKQWRAYLYKHPEANLHNTNQNWRSFIPIKHHCRMQISLIFTSREGKIKCRIPCDNQPQNESVFFIWHTSVSVPKRIYCWRLCENLLSLFLQHHKHQNPSTSIYPLANLAPVTWTVFPCHEQVQQFTVHWWLNVIEISSMEGFDGEAMCFVRVAGRQSLKPKEVSS